MNFQTTVITNLNLKTRRENVMNFTQNSTSFAQSILIATATSLVFCFLVRVLESISTVVTFGDRIVVCMAASGIILSSIFGWMTFLFWKERKEKFEVD